MNENRPILLTRIFQAFVVFGTIPMLVNTIDILLNPIVTPFDGLPILRPIYGLFVAPITIALGIFCVRRVPQNIIGWMLIAMGYGTSALGLHINLFDTSIVLIIGSFFIDFFWFSYLCIFLYFPTGKLFPARLNRHGNRILAIIFFILLWIPIFFSAEIRYGTAIAIPNRLVIVNLNYSVVTVPLIIGTLLAGLVTLILRYRGGSITERHQLRWLIMGMLLQFVPTFLISNIQSVNDFLAANDMTSVVTSTIYTFATPFAIANAILRHRLYDIDIIIRRTLIYAVLTTILAVIYFGGVILAQQLFKVVTGQTSDLAIVVSTLLIAALFAPLRRRIQNVIDSRLYRRKYDAEKTLAQFQQNLRDEVDMQTLKANLVSVVSDTMQPDKIALWVREK